MALDPGEVVEAVPSAQDAFERLSKRRPDVLISDIGMPDEDGYSLIRKIRVLEEGGKSTQRTPAIALTAYARPEDRDRALAAGYQMHVAKPVGKDEVISTVTAVVGT